MEYHLGIEVKIRGEGPVIMVDDDRTDAYLAKTCFEMAKVPNPLVLLESGEALLDSRRSEGFGRRHHSDLCR